MYAVILEYNFNSVQHGHPWRVIVKINTAVLINSEVIDFTALKKAIHAKYAFELLDDDTPATGEQVSAEIYKIVENSLEACQKPYKIKVIISKNKNSEKRAIFTV